MKPVRHLVVDGSNIATEGRAMPSLRQLNDAVLAFIDEHPGALITVVVDATFGAGGHARRAGLGPLRDAKHVAEDVHGRRAYRSSSVAGRSRM